MPLSWCLGLPLSHGSWKRPDSGVCDQLTLSVSGRVNGPLDALVRQERLVTTCLLVEFDKTGRRIVRSGVGIDIPVSSPTPGQEVGGLRIDLDGLPALRDYVVAKLAEMVQPGVIINTLREVAVDAAPFRPIVP